MCFGPKIPKTPPPAQYQQMQQPKDFLDPNNMNRDRMRRRGLYAAIFTSPSGVGGAPVVTGTGGGATGG
jgi:hypothetical protein